MDNYKQNIECFKKYKGQIYDAFKLYENSLKNLPSEIIEDIEVHSVNTKDNFQSLIVKKNQKEYRMNSIIHPVLEAERWVKQYQFHNLNSVVAIFGLGNGLFAQKIAENMGESNRVIICEPSVQVFMHVLHQYDLSYLLSHERVEIAVEEINIYDFHKALQHYINIANIKTKIMCMHPGYDKVFPEQGILFWKELSYIDIFIKTNINTEMCFGKFFIENILGNLVHLKNSNTINELAEVLPVDNPIIIVAGGPSVEENIEALKKAKDKFIIIAVDRSLDFLLDNGIEPDLIASVDPIKPIELFTRRDNVTIPLLCILETQTEILKIHKGKKIITRVNRFMKEAYTINGKEAPKTASGSSVATMAFCAAIAMGFKTIILVGQDLAYRGNVTHLGGMEEVDGIDVMVDGIDGEQVRSRSDWLNFIRWYQDVIDGNSEIKVYDAKESGAKIRGTIVKSLDSILEEYEVKQTNYRELVDNLEVTFNEEQLLRIKEYFDGFCDTLDEIKKKAMEACTICDYFLNEDLNNDDVFVTSDIYLRDLNDITEYVSECDIYYLLESYISANATQEISNIYKFTGNQAEDRKDTYEKSKCIFQTIADGCDYLKPLIEKKVVNIL